VILEASVAIVGSGMGGATTAYGLAEAGIDCLVIERGDFVKKEDANCLLWRFLLTKNTSQMKNGWMKKVKSSLPVFTT